MRVLTVNAGSSSLKLALVDEAADTVLGSAELPAPRARADEREIDRAIRDGLGDAEAVGHRVVHGGERFTAAVRLEPRVREELGALCDLAPLHQPKSLDALDTVSRLLPGVPAVACFDTAFHASLPPAARTYAIPAQWRERFGVRRYGFHGLSHSWVARQAPKLLDEPGSELRIVSCHLGAGASLCAIAGGRSVDTTMGFTPLEGLVMATRSGSVDPGALLWLAEHARMRVRDLADALEHSSGLLALSGSADMKTVLVRAAAGDGDAALALDVYVHRLCGSVAAMTAALGGLDALVFTGGVGERSAELRERAVAGLGFLGAELDAPRNRSTELDADIGAAGAPVRTLVLRAREELEIARQTGRALAA